MGKIKNAKIMQLKETCDELPDKKTRLAAGLKDIDAEYAARVAGIEANVLRRDKAERKRKREAEKAAKAALEDEEQDDGDSGGGKVARVGGATKTEEKKEPEEPWYKRCEERPMTTWSCFSEGYAVLQHAVGYGRPLAKGYQPPALVLVGLHGGDTFEAAAAKGGIACDIVICMLI